ncbi:hypothetical protein Droror1_Dr00005906 [Drosera rotundifolia]
MVAVLVYIMTNAVDVVLFLVPTIGMHIVTSNCTILTVLSWWIQVYFMNTQIWYSVLCAIFGGVYGILNHLGEIRTLRMLRSSFPSLPSAFNSCLIPPSSGDGGGMHLFRLPFKKDPRSKDKRSVRYDRDREWSYLLHHPFQKLSTAVSIAWDFVGKDEDLFNCIMNDAHMNCAVKECYESLMCILDSLVVGDIEKR